MDNSDIPIDNRTNNSDDCMTGFDEWLKKQEEGGDDSKADTINVFGQKSCSLPDEQKISVFFKKLGIQNFWTKPALSDLPELVPCVAIYSESIDIFIESAINRAIADREELEENKNRPGQPIPRTIGSFTKVLSPIFDIFFLKHTHEGRDTHYPEIKAKDFPSLNMNDGRIKTPCYEDCHGTTYKFIYATFKNEDAALHTEIKRKGEEATTCGTFSLQELREMIATSNLLFDSDQHYT